MFIMVTLKMYKILKYLLIYQRKVKLYFPSLFGGQKILILQKYLT